MAIVEPGKGRAVIEHGETGLRITIPAEIQPKGMMFMCLWLTIWVIAEAIIAFELLTGEPTDRSFVSGPLLSYFWFAMWTVAGMSMIYTLLWQVVGKEIIELSSTLLRLRKRILFFSLSRDFAVSSIRNMRPISPRPKDANNKNTLSHLSFRDGAITFDYGRTTRYLGQDLNEAEAQYVIDEMCEHVKSLRAEASGGNMNIAGVEHGRGRAIIENDGTGLHITIPAEFRLGITAFGFLWLIIWAYVEFLLPYLFLKGKPGETREMYEYVFMAIFTTLWTYGGIGIIAELLWSIAGKEIIELNSIRLKRTKQIPIFRRSREYDVNGVANLRFASPPAGSADTEHSTSSLSLKDGTIVFDHGRGAHYLASGLDEADAKYVIEQMSRRVKSLGANEEVA
ncbi:hypothetical protein [Taklimakanibacter lacteus]|uniref:hypothetical protein n=1 Tax=Taklimakanibacter lacteus TaxID=2268456 RepID=UPI000E675A6A